MKRTAVGQHHEHRMGSQKLWLPDSDFLLMNLWNFLGGHLWAVASFIPKMQCLVNSCGPKCFEHKHSSKILLMKYSRATKIRKVQGRNV